MNAWGLPPRDPPEYDRAWGALCFLVLVLIGVCVAFLVWGM